jgi:asparagine synthase (glutamine-hydrolysing)
MCGIAGFLDLQRATGSDALHHLATAMADTLLHRGPDDGGAWVDAQAGVALGHRRLEVVGRGAQGQQPMHSASARWVLSYNGELYNTEVLRHPLQDAGATFHGTSDTEVLVAGLDHWGLTDTLERMEGMFAFAAWDRRERRLHLARDRFGEKPLFYGWAGPQFAFASELKAFHALPSFRPEVDRDVVARYLQLSCVPAPDCIYRGLAKLRPGATVSIDTDTRAGQLPPQVAYWSAERAIDEACALPQLADDREATDVVEAALSDSVAARTVAEVPVGALLSGGIDSSLTVALMQQHTGHPVRTFTVSFEDEAFDEAESAAAVADHLGTEHTTVAMTAQDVFDLVPQVPDIWDEPFSDSSQLPTHLVAMVARRAVTVALSGDGGDELFAGYNRHAWLDRVWRAAAPLPASFRRGVGGTLRRIPPGAIDATAARLPQRFQTRLPSTKVAKLGRVLQASTVDDAYVALASHWEDPASIVLGAQRSEVDPRGHAVRDSSDGVMAQLLRTDLVTYLPDDVLTKVDRASMAVSLETRTPFLDRGVLEAAWRLPGTSKLRDGVSKWILRQVLYRHVPAVLVDRPKMGFGIPLDDWLRGPLRPWAEDLLSTASLNRHGLLRPEPVRQAWQQHLAKRRDLSYELWDVLMLQAWMERWASG